MSRTVLFAGGGTGGHLYPGLAIAERLHELDERCRCVFLCSDRPLDAEILGAQGVEFLASPAQPLVLRPRGAWRFVRAWRPAVDQACSLLDRLERDSPGEVHVAAMGGFAAAPAVQAASRRRTPIVLVNLDAVPGKANRWIARRADQVITAARLVHGEALLGRAGAAGVSQEIPPIVRRAALAPFPQPECKSRLGLDRNRPVLMVTGGSQGARSINRLLQRLVESPAGAAALRAGSEAGGWQVLHQTGNDDAEAVARSYGAREISATVAPFVTVMNLWWGAADLAIARSGAGNVAEVWANNTPAVFLPYPFHKDQHQRHNAVRLAECGGAVIVRDHVDPEKNLADAGHVLLGLLTDGSRRQAMRLGLASLGPADGADRVARLLLHGTLLDGHARTNTGEKPSAPPQGA